MLQTGDRRAANLAFILSGYLRETFEATDASLRQLVVHSRRIGGAAAPDSEWLPVLRSARAGLTGIGSVSIMDTAGIIRRSTQPAIVGQSRRDDFIFGRLAGDTSDQLVASTPFRILVGDHRMLIPLGRRLTTASGRFDGIVVGMFDPANLRGVFHTVDVGKYGTVWVFHKGGAVVLREPSTANPIGETAIGNSLFERAKAASDSGFFRGSIVAGAPITRSAFRTIREQPLIVAVSLNEAEVLEEWRHDTGNSIAIIVLVAVVVAAVLTLLFRQIDVRAVAEAALVRSQRLESLGKLTGGVAHDFNNLLTVIFGFVSVLKTDVARDGATRDTEALDEIERAATRAADLTRRLLAFARRQPLHPKVVDLNELVRAARPMLARTLGEDVTLKLNLTERPCLTKIDPVQLETALLNLCVNARDALPNGGLLIVETTHVVLDQHYARENPEVSAGRYALLAIHDNGTGISAEHLPRLFEPFFTTKPPGQGTGLGLSMVYGFVKQSEGHVKVYSELGHGTVVKMYFPEQRSGAPTPPAPVAPPGLPPPQEVPSTGSVILLVEDEPAVRAIATRVLEGLGYHVIATIDGPSALAAARQMEHIDLLFTDVMLPGGMTGFQIAGELTRERPGLPVLYASGYSEEIVQNRALQEGAIRLISKPYNRAELATAIHAALHEA
jgi:signal transduction histidine kinase/CheY-like chemotaxis protein